MSNSYDIKLPSIKATTLQGKIDEMQSYIYQMVGQLNWALNTIETSGGKDSDTYNELKKVSTSLTENSNAMEGETPQETFDRIKALIIKSADIVEAYEQQMELVFDGKYVADSDFGTFAEETNTAIQFANDGISTHTEQIQTINGSLTTMDGVVKQNTADIQANASAITSKVSKIIYNTDKATMEDNISTAQQTANSASTTANAASQKATALESSVSKLSQKADGISAEVSKKVDVDGGSKTQGAGWNLTSDAFSVSSNGKEVLSVDENGLLVNGDGRFEGNMFTDNITARPDTEDYMYLDEDGITFADAVSQKRIATKINSEGIKVGPITSSSSEIIFNPDGTYDTVNKYDISAVPGGALTEVNADGVSALNVNGIYGNIPRLTSQHIEVKKGATAQGPTDGSITAEGNISASGSISEGGTSLEDKYASKNAVVPYYNKHNNNIDTTTLSSYVQTAESKGGNWVGTKPSGSHNGLGIIHLLTHPKGTVGVYAGQLAFDTNQNCLWFRSSNDEANFKAWKKLAYVDDIPTIPDVSGKLDKSGGTMTGQLKWKDLNALPQFSQPAYLLGIESFANGGTTKWASTKDVTVGNATNATNADTVDGYHASDFAPISNGIGETAGGRNLANFTSISGSDGGYPFRFINPSKFVIENQSTSTIYPRMGNIYLEAGTYTLSAVGLTNTIYIEFYDENLTYDKSIDASRPSYTFTITTPKTMFLMGVIGAGKSAYTVAIMLEKGNEAHTYEPFYQSNKNLEDAIKPLNVRNLIAEAGWENGHWWGAGSHDTNYKRIKNRYLLNANVKYTIDFKNVGLPSAVKVVAIANNSSYVTLFQGECKTVSFSGEASIYIEYNGGSVTWAILDRVISVLTVTQGASTVAKGSFTQLFASGDSRKVQSIPLSTFMQYKYIGLYCSSDYSSSGGVIYPNDSGGGKIIPTDALLCMFNMAKAISDEGSMDGYRYNGSSLSLQRSGDTNITVVSVSVEDYNFIIGFN